MKFMLNTLFRIRLRKGYPVKLRENHYISTINDTFLVKPQICIF